MAEINIRAPGEIHINETSTNLRTTWQDWLENLEN